MGTALPRHSNTSIRKRVRAPVQRIVPAAAKAFGQAAPARKRTTSLCFRDSRVNNLSSLVIHELPFTRRQSPSKGNFAPRLIACVKGQTRNQLKQFIGLYR